MNKQCIIVFRPILLEGFAQPFIITPFGFYLPQYKCVCVESWSIRSIIQESLTVRIMVRGIRIVRSGIFGRRITSVAVVFSSEVIVGFASSTSLFLTLNDYWRRSPRCHQIHDDQQEKREGGRLDEQISKGGLPQHIVQGDAGNRQRKKFSSKGLTYIYTHARIWRINHSREIYEGKNNSKSEIINLVKYDFGSD